MKKNDEDHALKKGQGNRLNLKMKFCFLMATFMLFQLSANTVMSQKKMEFNYDNVPLKRILNEINVQTGYRFFYNVKEIDDTKRTSLNADEETINEVLNKLSVKANFDFRINKNQIVLTKKKITAYNFQDNSVTGTVTDNNGTPLAGANVLEKGTLNGTQTDFDGNFTLEVIDKNATLIVSYIGFASREMALNGKTVINVRLDESAAGLEEVVVIGYGSVKKSDLTGSVSSIQGDRLNTDSQPSVEQVMQGRLPGVQVTQSNAAPGGAFSVRIRGTNSITAGNEPLYVIDGLAGANPENSLNPSDIKSIEVLKDASATAIYGARGSNGVVLITTKQGRKNSPLEVSYYASTGFQSAAKKLDLLNAQEYMSFYNGLFEDRGREPLFGQEDFARIGSGTDWQEEILRSAVIQEHRVSFSGGSEDTQYFLSLNSFDQDGIVINSGFKRFGARINLLHSIGERLKIGINLSNTAEKENRVVQGNGANTDAGVVATALQLPPTMPVFDQDGNYARSLQDLNNSVALAETTDDFLKTTRLFGNAFLEYEFLTGLKGKINVGYDQGLTRRDQFLDVVSLIGALNEGQATQSFRENNDYLFEFTLNYDKSIKEKHSLNLLGGYSYQEFTNSGFNASALNFPTPSFGSNNLGAGDNTRFDVGSFKARNTIVSGFGRINYSFDERYLMSASIRADGSSRFGENNKFSYFPSGALAWNISNESFFPEDGLVSNLKIRASYGLSGNQEIDNAQSLVLLGSGPVAVFDGIEYQSISPVQLANPNLQWETTEALNFGLDFGLFENRLSGTVEYFQNNTRDLLLSLPIPTTTGFASSLQNVGDTRNNGFELSLSSRNFTGDFSWRTDLNIATLQNEVRNLGELERILQGDIRFIFDYTLLEVGKPINSYFGYIYDGVFQTQEEVDNSPEQTSAAVGGRKFRDLNDDGVINTEDRTVLGDPFPEFTLGLNNSLSFKGFTLDVFLEGRFGYELANITNIDSENPIDDLRNRQSYVLDRWTPDNPTNENPSFANPSRTYDFNSRVVEDASFLRLRNIRLAYGFPNLNSDFISDLTVFASGQNLATWTDYKGYNPDVSSRGNSNIRIDYNAYPLASVYSLGINLKF